MSRITQVLYGECSEASNGLPRRLELTATVDEGEDPMAVYRALKSTVRKTLGIGPTQEQVDAALKTLDDAGMVQQRTAPPLPVEARRKGPEVPEP